MEIVPQPLSPKHCGDKDTTPYWSCMEIVPQPLSPKHCGEKDIVAPDVPASGSERPSHLKRRSQAAVVSVKEELERCSCCTKEEFWAIYDIFASMDRRQEDSVR